MAPQARGHTTLRALAAELNTVGMQTRRGGRWHVSNVRNLLGRQKDGAATWLEAGAAGAIPSSWTTEIFTKEIAMPAAIGLLLACQLAGEIMTRSAGLPIPGPVAGLVLLLVLLMLRPGLAEAIRPTVRVILANLSLLFVPAGVGVVGNLEVLAEDGLPLLVVLVLSTFLSMLAAVGTFIAVSRLAGRKAG